MVHSGYTLGKESLQFCLSCVKLPKNSLQPLARSQGRKGPACLPERTPLPSLPFNYQTLELHQRNLEKMWRIAKGDTWRQTLAQMSYSENINKTENPRTGYF